MFWEIYSKLCEKKGSSASAVCAELGYSNAQATHWKNGSIPKGDALEKIADYFDVSVDYLLGRTEFPEVNQGQFRLDSKNDTEFGEVFEFDEGYMFLKKGAQLTPALKAEFEQMKNVKEGK